MTRIVLTGGAGFIGSHIADHIIRTRPGVQLTIFDLMTYAADFRNVAGVLAQRHTRLIVGDICDLAACSQATKGADLVIHVAAESHVDNSFGNSLRFSQTNVLGTHTLIEACRANKVPRILHVSTDEVYGDIVTGAYDEGSPLNPTNPYSASKAAAEMVIRGYVASFGLPVVMIRGNNIYGTRQYPEKIIPKFCMQLARGRQLTVHGDGSNIRSYLAVQDFATALAIVVETGRVGDVYNVGTTEEYTNLQIAGMLSEKFGKDVQEQVRFVTDRPFNDRRYSVNCAKLGGLGWKPQKTLVGELDAIVAWYRDNGDRYQDVEL